MFRGINMICSKCGYEIEEGELFCGNCGAPVSEKQDSPEKEESPVSVADNQVNAEASPEDGSEKPAGKKWNKTPVVIAVFFIWLLLVAGLFFMIYSIVMKASTMRLSDYEREVTLTSGSGRVQELKPDMRIFGGSELKTGKKSKAIVLLDEDRMVTVMENSTVKFAQSGKSISLSLDEGDLFFNIARDLEEDESFEISVSTMIIGIRGTSGYVRENEDGYPVLYLTGGKVMAYAEDPDSGEEDQRRIRAGQKLTVIIIDGEIQMVVEDITENDLPEEALFEIVSDDSLFDEVIEETGWDEETLSYLYDSYKYGIKDDDTEPDQGVAVGKAEEIVGTWLLDPELSSDTSAIEKTLTFNDDMTGNAYFHYTDRVEKFDFTWDYIDVTSMVSIDCEDNTHDAAMFYEDGKLIWLSNTFYKSGTMAVSDVAERSYEIVGRFEPDLSEDSEILSMQFNSDNTGVVKTLVGGAYHDIQIIWSRTDDPKQYHVRIAPQQYIIGLGRSEFDIDFYYDFNEFYFEDILFVRASVNDFAAQFNIDVPDSFATWTYEDYQYWSAWNGKYYNPVTKSEMEFYLGEPAGSGAGGGAGALELWGKHASVSYYGDGMFWADYDGGMLFWLTEEGVIKIQYPYASGTFYYFEKT